MLTSIRSDGRAKLLGRPHARLALAVVGACTLCASCARVRNPFISTGPPAPDVLVAAAPLDQIIAAVNQNAQRIRTYQTNNATIHIPGSLGIPSLRGHIAVERPQRVRLQASTGITGPEVDLGSNDELYWFWVRRNEPPQVYFARHAQAGGAAQQLMPIDPQWLLDALGLAVFNPTDRHEGPLPIGKNRVEIKSIVQTPSGQLVKRTVIDAQKAWVLEQHLTDAAGQPLASAVAKSHRYYPETGASLPQVVEIRIPPADLAMTIDVGTVELNRLGNNPAMWTMPVIPGSPAVDLGATMPADVGGGAPTLGSQLHNADWYDPVPVGGVPPTVGAPAASVATTAVPPFVAPGTPAPLSAPAMQTLPAGGTVAQTADPFAPQPIAPLNAQRLPAGGTPATDFKR